jgi:penicillin-binding protein 2
MAARPEIARSRPERTRIMNLRPDQLADLRNAMVGVVSAGGTAASAALGGGVTLAGKTGTAQTVSLGAGRQCDHAWFVGFAPVEAPKIVVSVMLECGGHGYLAARLASDIVAKHLGVKPISRILTEGN